jgi:hypothetical protein
MSIVTIRVCASVIFVEIGEADRPAVQNVEFLNNPARFQEPYKFRVIFECVAELEDGA